MRKFTKKTLSLALASIVGATTIFSGNVTNAFAATYKTMADTNLSNYNVTFKAPATWTTGDVYAYAYNDVATASGEEKRLTDYFPGDKLSKNSDGTYSISLKDSDGAAKVIFTNMSSVDKSAPITSDTGHKYYKFTQIDGGRRPENTADANGQLTVEDPGYVVTSDSFIDGTVAKSSAVSALATATPTATVKPTAVPTVEPVDGPQVNVSVENGTSFDEDKNDTLPVTISLANGATSATYSIDNGTKKTITSDTIVKVGEGKIANSPVTLTVESTDGKTTNTQTFTYFKSTSVASTVSVQSVMKKLSATVRKASTDIKKTLPVHFRAPAEDWFTNGASVYCYAYYDQMTSEGIKTIKPLGIWPGTKMTQDTSDKFLFHTSINTTTGDVKIMFVAVKGSLGELVKQGTILDAENGIRCSEEFYPCEELYKLPYGYSEAKDEYGNNIPNEGLRIENETTVAIDGYDTNSLYVEKTVDTPVNPDYASPVPATATPNVNLPIKGYFGASVSAPQTKGTKVSLTTITLNTTSDATYTFSVDGKEIYSGAKNTTEWDTSSLDDGTYNIATTVTDGTRTFSATKTFTIASDELATATPEVATATAIATASVAPTATIKPTAVATDSAIEASAVPNPVPLTLTIKAATKKTAGEAIKVSVKLGGFDEVAKYKIQVKNNKTKTVKTVSKLSTKTSGTWTPTAAGTYTIIAKAYDEAGNQIIRTTKTYKVLTRVITINKIKPSSAKKGKKTTVSFTGKSTKAKLTLKVVITKGSKKYVSKSFNAKKKKATSCKFTWKPKAKGTYKIKITGKSNGKTVVVTKTIKVK
ncbi:MAG: starch-binding protein [Lachnospiraceae bacterium]|nr:starch-binding protein [Lachnospiraceae bacterium]